VSAKASDRIVRVTLWISVPFNIAVALMLLFPASAPSALLGLPPTAPALYAALSALFVFMFGLAYAWMAMRPAIPRELLGFSAICKSSVFVMALILWALGHDDGRTAATAVGDLLLAAVWIRWLLATR
jgi:hypothetical protein